MANSVPYKSAFPTIVISNSSPRLVTKKPNRKSGHNVRVALSTRPFTGTEKGLKKTSEIMTTAVPVPTTAPHTAPVRTVRIMPFVLKLELGRDLAGSDAADLDMGFVVVLGFDGRRGHAAQHGDLSDVGQGVGDRSLKQFFKRRV